MTTTISGIVNHGVGLDPGTDSNPVIVTGTIADPNTNDSALSGGGQVWTIINQGLILESGAVPSYGIRILSGGDITNSGTIQGNGSGISLSTATINNSGTIIGVANLAIATSSGGTVTNAASGFIRGGNGAIGLVGTSGGTVTNFGTVTVAATTGLPAIRISNFGTDSSVVVNGTPGSTALITGGGGVAISGVGTLTNFGTIVSKNPFFGDNYAYGVNITGTNSSVTNGAPGSTNAAILSFNLGVEMSGGGATLTNFGTIAANGSIGTAVDMLRGGSVLNGTPGSTVALITGSEFGVYRATTVTNYGTIVGTTGEGIGTGSGQAATIVNGASGLTTPIITGKAGVKFFGTAGTLTNSGTVLGTGDVGASFSGSAMVANGHAGSTAGLIQGSYGINISGAGTITNFGTIIGTAGRAVFAGGGGTLVNGSPTDTGRQIIGTSDGAQFFIYVLGTIRNFGTIQATATSGTGASVRAGGDVVNGTAGSANWLISGGARGVNGATNLTNYGTISGAGQAGVQYGGGGSIVNAQGALITGANGVSDKAASVTNAGTIIATAGNGNGVHLYGTTGVVTNSGAIQAGYRGVVLDNAGTVVNTGAITATSQQGVFIGHGGAVTNVAGKSIIGGNAGVNFFIYGPGTVTNAGTIIATATDGIGLNLRGGGNATNASTGLIKGGRDGADGATNLTNYGTIIGTARSGVQYGSGGTIINAQGALITGANGVFNKAASVTNAGTIVATAGNGSGVHLYGTAGVVTNSGSIQAGYRGVHFDNAGTVVNTGAIAATSQQGIFIGRGGAVSNAAGKSITGGNYGVNFFIYGAGTVTNSGTIGATATSGIGLSLRSGGTATNNAGALMQGPITGVALSGTGGVVANFGTIAGNTAVYVSGANDRVIAGAGAVFGGTLRASGSGNTLELAAGAHPGALQISGFTNLQFDGGASGTVEGSAAGLPGTISGFAVGDTIDVDGFVAASDTYTGSGLVLTDSASNHVTLGINGSFSTSDFKISSDGHGGTDVTIPCFCRGTMILTERGEVAVEDLAVGDRVKTLSGAMKPIVWIGIGRDLVTRRNRLARPIIVRQGALADNMPARDLYLTHGHALYLESAAGGALIPVEHLVNHRSILWDEAARVVEYFHIELEDHDVLLAEGAPAESYHDAGNRAGFHNSRPGSAARAGKPTVAPVLHGGDTVETAWARLFARAGGEIEQNVTDEPDLHLVADGERIEPEASGDGVYRFAVARPPTATLLLRSRRGVPSLIGQGRSDHRPLGVAITQIVLEQAGIATYFDYDQPQLREAGCYPHEDGFAWTDGELALPARFFTLLDGAFTLVVRTEPHLDMRYPMTRRIAQAA